MFNLTAISENLFWLTLITGFVISGCSHTSELYRADHTDMRNPEYTIIYYIHADSDYLYHDSSGKPVQGNSVVLTDAFSVAEKAVSGEVFIFYQKPERRIAGLFPRRSSRLYHYTGGELTGRVKYRHSDGTEDFLTSEVRLYNQYRNALHQGIKQNHFLYFGHEIPESGGEKYHRTLPKIKVNTGSFATGVHNFLANDDQRFDLIVLSTCNNGSPVMASHLIPISNVLLASPQNLHLSHIDSESLSLMESNPGITAIELAQTVAEQTFKRLESDVQTAITLAVYNFDVVKEYKSKLQSFAVSYQKSGRLNQYSDNMDCRQASFFDDAIFSKGLITWYKSARFGRTSFSSNHSGWGCKPLMDNDQE